MDEVAFLLPPGSQGVSIVARDSVAEREGDSRLCDFGRMFFGVDTRREDLYSEVRQLLLLFFESGQLPPTEGSPESAIEEGDAEI